jgi:hypothetical protein
MKWPKWEMVFTRTDRWIIVIILIKVFPTWLEIIIVTILALLCALAEMVTVGLWRTWRGREIGLVK